MSYFGKPEQAISGHPQTTEPLTGASPVELYGSGLKSGVFNKFVPVNDSFQIAQATPEQLPQPKPAAGSDQKDAASRPETAAQPQDGKPRFDVIRNSTGAPVEVKDREGNTLRKIEYNADGTLKQVVDRDRTMRQNGDMIEWHGSNFKVAKTGTLSVDNDGNIITTTPDRAPVKIEPDGTIETTMPGRDDWAARAQSAHVERSGNEMQVLDKDGKPIRTIFSDENGPNEIVDSDGKRYLREADGKAWDFIGQVSQSEGYIKNMTVDAQGNITYETVNVSNQLATTTSFIDGRFRYGLKR